MINRVFGRLVEWLCIVLMVVLAVDLMLGVVSRYVFAMTFTWYDEVARVCFTWLVFLAAAAGIRRGAHFGLHIVVDRLPPGGRRVAELATPVVIIAFALVLIVQGLAFVDLGWFQMTPVMGLPKAWVYAAMPTGGALMIAYSLAPLWRAARGVFG
ncbi:MAG: TRAP transporter small permease [Alphaproteobacteria bacterium]|nr:TRAP transporter small permease [Alphaproteobacteria bacterium]